MTYGLVFEVKAQSQSTRIVSLEVDGKEVKNSYRIFFLSGGRWIEAQKTADRFTLPKAIQKEEYLTLMIMFGGYRLKFERVHISNFTVDWIVGIDKEPFSEDLVPPGEKRAIRQ